ncbi:MAG: PAS domain S-box protein [Thermoplasmata archaeon]|nr:MAG: PAS domain S-box protein [Thermoplasmata archaeon]
MDLEVARSLADLVSVDAMVTEDGSILYANPSLSKRGEVSRGWSKTEGHHVCEVFDDEHQTQVREWYDELRAREDRFGILELRPGKGGPLDSETLTAIRLEDVELIVIRTRKDLPLMDRFRDLETSSRILRNYLVDGNVGMMIMQDEDDREAVIRYVSPEAAVILDREASALVGLELGGFVAPEDRDEFLVRCREGTGSPRAKGDREMRFLDPAGDYLMLDTVVGSTVWEGEPAVYCLFRDETERQLMVEELRRFEQGFEMLQDTLVLADRDFNVIYINPTGLKRSGYTWDEVMGRPASIFASLDDGQMDPLEVIQQLFDTGYYKAERMAIAKDGHRYPVEVAVSMTTDPNGDPEMVAVHSRDISERKEAEHNILRARERAEFFTDLMAHDINNYIQGVIGFLDLLGKSQLEGEQAKYVRQANEQASRVSDLIERVRTISKAQHPEELKPVDLRAVIDQEVADIRHKYADQELDIVVDEAEGPVPVMADDLLNDLVLNLLDNAVKFSTIPMPKVEISLAPREDDGYVTLSIADRGPGIVDEDKDQVFFRFVRRREEAEGTGLGLSLVMALVDRYKGRVWIEDRVPGEPGEGAVFKVELPLA